MALNRTKEFSLLLLLSFILFFTAQAQITRIDTIKSTSINFRPAQHDNQRLFMYTIGIKAYSLEEFPRVLNEVKTNHNVSTLGNGVLLKLNDNQISYRIGANFYSKDISFKNECKECEEANGKLKDFSTRIGFEKNFVYGTIQPYFAFDIGYRRNSFDGNLKNLTTLATYDVNTLKNGFLMSPNFGLKVSPASHITLALETGIDLLYSYEKQEKTSNQTQEKTVNQYRKWEFLLKPVSLLSLQYNFGLTY
jgi:hypothetical protein